MYKSYYLYIPAIVFWLLWILWKYLFSTKNNSNKQIFLNSLLYAYLVFVFGLTLFPIPTTAPQTESIISFTPLEIILPMFSLDSAPIAQYILSSVVLFIPFGLLTPLFMQNHRLLKTTLLTILLAVSIETIQYLIGANLLNTMYTNVCIDDILLSILGSAVGFIIFSIIPFSVKNQFIRNSRRLKMQVYRPEIILTKRP